jgi:hypothetical protein
MLGNPPSFPASSLGYAEDAKSPFRTSHIFSFEAFLSGENLPEKRPQSRGLLAAICRKNILNMNISKLILDKNLLTIKIGENINSVLNLELINNQDGDIPALFGYNIGNNYFEITAIENIVIGIKLDFKYETENISFELNGNKIILNGETKFRDLIFFLKNTNLDFNIVESKIEPKRITLKKSDTNFYFSDEDERLLIINNFDWNIYEKYTNCS